MTVFTDLASYIDSNLLNGMHVYSYPPDTFKAPAIVLTPGSPFQAPITQSQGGVTTVMWGIECQLVVSRSQPKWALDHLYDLRKWVTDLLVTYTTDRVRWLTFDSIETVQIGGADYLQGTLTLAVTAEETYVPPD